MCSGKPFLEIQGHGGIAKLKSILSVVNTLQVLEGHCNCINFRDFITGFVSLIKNGVGEKARFMEPPP